MLNKRGYVMVYAIGVIALLMLLAASLSQITMTRTNWTNKQSYNIKQMNYSKAQVEAAASELATFFDAYRNVDNKYLYELNTDFQSVFDDIELRYNVIIRNLTVDSCEYPTDPNLEACYPLNPNLTNHEYTYAYDIVYDGPTHIAQKRFFLSMIPSFLYFALGSKTDLTFNGGAFINGNMYVNNNLYTADVTNYKVDDFIYTEPTSFPTITTDSKLYLNNTFYSCTNEPNVKACYDLSSNNFIKTNFSKPRNISDGFVSTPPNIMTYNDRFLDVNFDASFKYYLNEAIGDKNREIDLNNLDAEFQTFNNENRLYVATSFDQLNDQEHLAFYIKDPGVLNQSIQFTKNQWIIVHGDLTIENYDNLNQILIDANLIVTGNITIAGYVQFNSTTYSLGRGIIHNANINYDDINNNELVLLTKQNLQFSRINEFNNKFEGVMIDPSTGEASFYPNIKGFFYTDSFVNIFTVSSYLVIEGGIYSNDINNLILDENEKYIVQDNPTFHVTQTDSIGMIINSYRGEVHEDNDPSTSLLKFYPSDYYKQARFVVNYSPSIIETQPKGLPLNKEINYIFDDVTVLKK